MRILVLCSGGLKSAFLVALAKRDAREVRLLFIAHNQKHLSQEVVAVHSLARHFSCPVIVVATTVI